MSWFVWRLRSSDGGECTVVAEDLTGAIVAANEVFPPRKREYGGAMFAPFTEERIVNVKRLARVDGIGSGAREELIADGASCDE